MTNTTTDSELIPGTIRMKRETKRKLKLCSTLKDMRIDEVLDELLTTELAFLTKGGIEL